MIITLPDAIARYFAVATATGAPGLADIFAQDAVVRDERKTMRGLAEIAAWRTEALRKYSFVAEPLSVVERDGKTLVTAKVTGNFPGSPINIDYAFEVRNGRIATLDIG